MPWRTVITPASAAEQREAQRVAVSWLKAMAKSEIGTACQLMDAENHSPHREYPNWSPAKLRGDVAAQR
jgi:hypothetical protein